MSMSGNLLDMKTNEPKLDLERLWGDDALATSTWSVGYPEGLLASGNGNAPWARGSIVRPSVQPSLLINDCETSHRNMLNDGSVSKGVCIGGQEMNSPGPSILTDVSNRFGDVLLDEDNSDSAFLAPVFSNDISISDRNNNCKGFGFPGTLESMINDRMDFRQRQFGGLPCRAENYNLDDATILASLENLKLSAGFTMDERNRNSDFPRFDYNSCGLNTPFLHENMDSFARKHISSADLFRTRYYQVREEEMLQEYLQYENLMHKKGLCSCDNSYIESAFAPQGRSLQNDDFLPVFWPRGSASRSYIGSLGDQESLHGDFFEASILDNKRTERNGVLRIADIVNNVVKISMDQYGSRFIQQKLETSSVAEKNLIFPKILSDVIHLTTDIFGNYVVQKFFEVGTENQINTLADKLIGHVLSLSFQMYSCRVIQKALEVVDMNRKIQIVQELNGSVMKCIGDQNGNHVIQKCIECVPEAKIEFIIKPILQHVFELCVHQYGCRVIQRVLEHCGDAATQSAIFEEILRSLHNLVQDQYGNYVVQHILKFGKPEERSTVISKLTGQIVRLSQQKFASNVVETCLSHGTPEERQLLINEIVGSDDNDTLQILMKDQFGNYVIQKVLETCDDRNLDLILPRIKQNLSNLKSFTYGRHIVSRVEKLVRTGELRSRRPTKLCKESL